MTTSPSATALRDELKLNKTVAVAAAAAALEEAAEVEDRAEKGWTQHQIRWCSWGLIPVYRWDAIINVMTHKYWAINTPTAQPFIPPSMPTIKRINFAHGCCNLFDNADEERQVKSFLIVSGARRWIGREETRRMTNDHHPATKFKIQRV